MDMSEFIEKQYDNDNENEFEIIKDMQEIIETNISKTDELDWEKYKNQIKNDAEFKFSNETFSDDEWDMDIDNDNNCCCLEPNNQDVFSTMYGIGNEILNDSKKMMKNLFNFKKNKKNKILSESCAKLGTVTYYDGNPNIKPITAQHTKNCEILYNDKVYRDALFWINNVKKNKKKNKTKKK